MAIKNASDLLVYAKTASAVAQVTRVRVLTTDPIEVPDGGTTGTLKIDNITNDGGIIYDDISTAASTNTGSTVLTAISNVLTSATYDYVASAEQTDGNYKYRDFTNGAVGIVPTLSIKDGTATLNENAVIIEIVTPGSSAIFDPVAYSTSASFSTNMDLRDVTNKDSDGWSESLGGLKSFEVSTDLLQSINPDVPLDGTDFFDKLKNRSLVDLSFSDRIRNIIRTNLTQSGVDNFTLLNSVSQTNLQADPFSNYTASLLTTGASTSNKALKYTVDATRLHRKKINFSLYVKGQGSTTQLDVAFGGLGVSFVGNNIKATIVEGSGSVTHLAGIYWRVTGLSTSSWTRLSFQTDIIDVPSGTSVIYFNVYPGPYNSQNNDQLLTSSWQIELSPEVTDYQDPTNITHWQGNALVSSLSFDAGVEDNLTCSATFTGTGNVYPNGLGSELIGDTGFDDPSYWNVSGGSAVVEDGYGKIITTGALAKIYKNLNLTPGDFYLLTYTVHTSTQGSLSIHDAWENGSEIDTEIPSAVGTYSVLLKPGDSNLEIKRTSGATTIWLSSISLKKVL